MSPNDLLSVEDGRNTTSSSLQRQEPYYSDEGVVTTVRRSLEIEIIIEVVKRGQEILAADEKGNLTPTDALFRATEEIFPQHGIDTDEPRLSRLLFKIGGKRQQSLLERLQSVLESMDIQVTLDGEPFPLSPPPPQQQQHRHPDMPQQVQEPDQASSSVESFSARSSTSNLVRSAPAPAAVPLGFRRRRNSDSVATLVFEDQPHGAAPPRRRSASIEAPEDPLQGGYLAQDKVPILSKWLRGTIGKPSLRNRLRLSVAPSDGRSSDEGEGEADVEEDDAQHSEQLDADEVVDEVEASGTFDDDGSEGDHDHDEGEAEDDRSDEFGDPHGHRLPLRPLNPILREDASQEADVSRNGQTNHSGMEYTQDEDESVNSTELNHKAREMVQQMQMGRNRLQGDGDAYEYYARPQYPAPQMDEVLPPSYGSHDAEGAGTGAIVRPRWTQARFKPRVNHQERTPFANENEPPRSHAVRAWQDQADRAKAEAELREMDMKLQILRQRQLESIFIRWVCAHKKVSASNWAIYAWAANSDMRSVWTGCLRVWREQQAAAAREAEELRERRAREEAARAKHESRMMRRAGRAYDLSLLHKAFTHWGASAGEEAERTEVARRHLLRKKVFGAWSRKTAADRHKVRCFVAGGLFGLWRAAAQDLRDAEMLALQLHPDCLARVALARMLREHQQRTVERWRSARVRELCVEMWESALRDVGSSGATAAAHSRRALQESATSSWRGQNTELAVRTSRGFEQVQNQECVEMLGYWQKCATLEGRLRTAVRSQEARLTARSLDVWRVETAALGAQQRRCQAGVMSDLAKHWKLEMRLTRFREDLDRFVLLNSTYQWVLEERLVLFRRYSEDSTKKFTLADLRLAFHDEVLYQNKLRALAERHRKGACLDAFVGGMRAQARAHGDLSRTCQAMDLVHVAVDAMGTWTGATLQHGTMEYEARRGAFYVGVANSLGAWPALAKAARDERLRMAYRGFRRRHKKETAARCVGLWRAAAQEELEAEWHFEEARAKQSVGETVDLLNVWIGETNRMVGVAGVAAEAEVEATASKWRARVEDMRASMLEAEVRDAGGLVAGRWEDWELELVKARGRRHTAAELADKNNKRLCRQALGYWLHQAQGGGGSLADVGVGGSSRTPLRSSTRSAPPSYFGGSAFSPFLPKAFISEDEPATEQAQQQEQQQSFFPRPRSQLGAHHQSPESLGLGGSSVVQAQQQPPPPPPTQQRVPGSSFFGSSFSQPMPSSWFSASRFSTASAAASPAPQSQPQPQPFTPQPHQMPQQLQQRQRQQQRQFPVRDEPSSYDEYQGGRDSVLPPISERSEGSTNRPPNSSSHRRQFSPGQQHSRQGSQREVQQHQQPLLPADTGLGDVYSNTYHGIGSVMGSTPLPPPLSPPPLSPPPPSADRLRSFKEKLRSASKFADSIQLGPMSEFDEDDLYDAPPAVRPSSAAAAAPGPAVMDTPTRWTTTTSTAVAAAGADDADRPRPASTSLLGLPGRGRGGGGGGGGRTTTPLAPLPSPMERRLREGELGSSYRGVGAGPAPVHLSGGGGFMARPSKLGRSWIGGQDQDQDQGVRTPRVKFAGLSDDGDDGGEEGVVMGVTAAGQTTKRDG